MLSVPRKQDRRTHFALYLQLCKLWAIPPPPCTRAGLTDLFKGAHYKFGVQVETSPLDKAPQPVLIALSQLIWAQEKILTRVKELVGREGIGHIKESMPLQPQDFNELLVLGYFEKSSISVSASGLCHIPN